MDYEIVELDNMTTVGITVRTKNSDADMTMKIGALWQQFYGNGIYASIPNKVNHKSICIYSDYETDVNSEYSASVVCQVTETEGVLEDKVVKIIPKGKYAKFIVRGNAMEAVEKFWQEFWKMDLDRSYECDFEEYQNESMEDAEVHIYISLNE